MQVTIITNELQAECLKNYNWMQGRTLAVEPHPTQINFFNVVIELPDYYDVSLVAQVLFHAGINYGLDLNYSSYDNNIPR